MVDKLARLNWQMGQTLLPEHFIAQEESLLHETHLRFRLTGVPFYGIGRLKWSEGLLSEGVLSIENISLVLPSGLLVDVPGNSKINSFNLNITGTTKVTLYLHVLGEEEVRDERESLEGEEGLLRKVRQIELSSEQSNNEALEILKFAEFQKDAEGVWTLSNSHIPPLLQVGTTPFLQSTLDLLKRMLSLFHYKLMQEITATYLSGENLFNAKQCLLEVYKFQRFLVNVEEEIHCHPYFFYEAVKNFYTGLCLYRNSTPKNISNAYQHDNLSSCLKETVVPLIEEIQLIKSKNPYVPFEKKDGLFVIHDLPKEIINASEVYFLVQKTRVNETLSIEGLKLASFSRLPVVHQLALVGVPYRKIDSPPFQHPFGAEVDFFILEEGEEWDRVLSQASLAFFDKPEFDKVKAYIYWRQ